MKRLALLATLLAATGTLLTAPATRAAVVASDIANNIGVSNGGSATFGYTFSLANSLTVTQLGFFDFFGSGLSGNVVVTIWDSVGVVQAQATVPGGTTAGESDGFLYTSLTAPMLLPVGTYTIGGYDTTSDYAAAQSPYTSADGITYGQARSSFDNTEPTMDEIALGAGSYFGPNFQFAAVPEPSTWALLSLGTVGAGVVASRRRRVCA